jgi:MFS family permease
VMFKNHSIGNPFRFLTGNTLVLSITGMLGNFARRMALPYVSLYILALGGSATQIGFINSLRPLAGLVAFPVAGHIADHAGRVKLILFGNFLSAFIVGMYFLAPTWQLIAVGAALQGFAVLMFPARSALIADSLAPGDRGRGIAAMNTIMSTLSMFAPFIAGIIVELYGPNTGVRALYGAMLVLYLATAFVHLRYLKEPERDSTERLEMSSLPRVLREAYHDIPATLRGLSRPLKALAAVVVLSFVANAVASPFWVVYAVDEIELTSSAWGLILLIEEAMKLALFIPAGMLVDRWGRTTSMLVALTLSGVAIPSFILASGFASVLLVRAVIAVAFVITIPACTALMADLVPRENRGRVMAALGQGGIMIGPAGGGTGGPAMGFVVSIPLILASLLGGYLYASNPVFPWVFVFFTTALSILLTVAFIRDPVRAEM